MPALLLIEPYGWPRFPAVHSGIVNGGCLHGSGDNIQNSAVGRQGVGSLFPLTKYGQSAAPQRDWPALRSFALLLSRLRKRHIEKRGKQDSWPPIIVALPVSRSSSLTASARNVRLISFGMLAPFGTHPSRRR
jgi:hypothetical protein